eukprot:1394385-Amorphochlora_amoeboformis.AAC.1
MQFGSDLIAKMPLGTLREFMRTFYSLPPNIWKGFLSHRLTSPMLVPLALLMFAYGNDDLRIFLRALSALVMCVFSPCVYGMSASLFVYVSFPLFSGTTRACISAYVNMYTGIHMGIYESGSRLSGNVNPYASVSGLEGILMSVHTCKENGKLVALGAVKKGVCELRDV